MKLWLYYLGAFFSIILTRYFIVAGGTYWLFYSSNHKLIKQPHNIKAPNRQAIDRDIALSIVTTLALSICAALIMYIYNSGATRLYSSIEERGINYLFISFWSVIFLQDTCYYFFHRGFHHPAVYSWLHRGHHRSKNPTPWTSFALDFPEALIQGLFLVVVVLMIPLHIYVLMLLLITMTVWALVNHLGFELFPSFSDRPIGKWFISSDHHSLHHRQYTKHFGLYFTFWDRLLDTN